MDEKVRFEESVETEERVTERSGLIKYEEGKVRSEK